MESSPRCTYLFRRGNVTGTQCSAKREVKGRCKLHTSPLFRYQFTINPSLELIMREIVEEIIGKEEYREVLSIDTERDTPETIFFKYLRNEEKIREDTGESTGESTGKTVVSNIALGEPIN